MSWLKMSDVAATHPVVLAVAEHPDADERSVDEVFGFMTRLAAQAAQHFTGYAVWFATAVQIAGPRRRAERLLGMAEFAGYGRVCQEEGTGRRFFQLVEDPDLFHVRTREEVEWERSRKADNGDYGNTVPVRRRDGDGCRYCGKVVNWADRKGGRGGTYDHRMPGTPGTWETMVVSCRSCNSARGAACRGLRGAEAMRAADAVLPLLPVPSDPYYSPGTRRWLTEHAAVLALHHMVPPEPAPDARPLRAGTTVHRAPGSSSAGASVGRPPRVAPGAGAPQGPPGGQPGGPAPSTQAGDPGSDDHAASEGIPVEVAPGTRPAGASVGRPPRVAPGAGGRGAPAGRPREDAEEDPGARAGTPAPTRRPRAWGGPAALPPPRGGPPDPGGAPPGPGGGPRGGPTSRSRQIPADRKGPGSGYSGTGRDGPGRACTGRGRDGPGQDGPGPGRRAPAGGRRRKRR